MKLVHGATFNELIMNYIFRKVVQGGGMSGQDNETLLTAAKQPRTLPLPAGPFGAEPPDTPLEEVKIQTAIN